MTPADCLHALRLVIESGQLVTHEQKVEAQQLLAGLEDHTTRLTIAERDALSANIDTTLHTPTYPDSASFWALWPTRKYFDAYVKIINKAESPPVYHFFSAAVAIGACTGLRCWYPTWPDHVYPNLAVCFVGPTGKAKKTTATKPAIEAIETLNEEEEAVHIIFNKCNPKSIIDNLSKRDTADCLVWAPEFSAFMSKEKSMEGFAPIFADLLDTHRKSGDLTVGAGQRTLHFQCISLLAASNMDWLKTSTPRDALNGGLLNRIIFIIQQERYKRSTLREWLTEPEPGQLDAVHQHLRWCNTMPPTVATVASDAEAYYDQWYGALSDNIDPLMAAYTERKHVHVLRLALILALADERTMIQKRDMVDSIKIMSWVEAFIPIMLEFMTGTPPDTDWAYVLRKLHASISTDPSTKQKTITKTKLAQDKHWKSRKASRVLADMVQAGLIRKCKIVPETYALVRNES